jgi:hypothetical protein
MHADHARGGSYDGAELTDSGTAAAGTGAAAPAPAADLLRNSMQSSTASLGYESEYEGLMRTDAALDGAPGAVVVCCCWRRPAPALGDVAADSIASRRRTSRTRSITDTDDAGAGGAPACCRGLRRTPPPPRSLGMHVTVFALRGSAGWRYISASIFGGAEVLRC